jgi:hypothetical protein
MLLLAIAACAPEQDLGRRETHHHPEFAGCDAPPLALGAASRRAVGSRDERVHLLKRVIT